VPLSGERCDRLGLPGHLGPQSLRHLRNELPGDEHRAGLLHGRPGPGWLHLRAAQRDDPPAAASLRLDRDRGRRLRPRAPAPAFMGGFALRGGCASRRPDRRRAQPDAYRAGLHRARDPDLLHGRDFAGVGEVLRVAAPGVRGAARLALRGQHPGGGGGRPERGLPADPVVGGLVHAASRGWRQRGGGDRRAAGRREVADRVPEALPPDARWPACAGGRSPGPGASPGSARTPAVAPRLPGDRRLRPLRPGLRGHVDPLHYPRGGQHHLQLHRDARRLPDRDLAGQLAPRGPPASRRPSSAPWCC
jgi:hypothetical protein